MKFVDDDDDDDDDAGSPALSEVCHCPVDVFLWQLFIDGLQRNFLLINCLGLEWENAQHCKRSVFYTE